MGKPPDAGNPNKPEHPEHPPHPHEPDTPPPTPTPTPTPVTEGFFHVPIGGGGQITRFSQADDGAAVICADAHGAYVADDGDLPWRLPWQQLFLKSTIPLHIQPLDRGYTHPYNDGTGCPEAVIARSDSSRIYAIWDGWFLKATGGDRHFVTTNFPRLPFAANACSTKAWSHAITVDPWNPDILLYGTQGHSVFWSTDGGDAVGDLEVAPAPIIDGDNYPATHLTAVDPTSVGADGLCRRWWHTVYGQGVFMSETGVKGPYALMAGSPDKPSSLYCDDTGDLWVTQFGIVNNVRRWYAGEDWRNIDIASGDQFFQIARDPFTPLRLFATGSGVCYMSMDGTTFPYRWGADPNYPEQTYNDQTVKHMQLGDRHFHPIINQLSFDRCIPGRVNIAWGSGTGYCDLPDDRSDKLHWIGTSEGIEELVVHTLCTIPAAKDFLGAWDMGAYDMADMEKPNNLQKIAASPKDTWVNTQPVLQQPCNAIDHAADDPAWVGFMQHGGWWYSPIDVPHLGFSEDGGDTLKPWPTEPHNKPYSNGGGCMSVGQRGQAMILWNTAARGEFTGDGGNRWDDLALPGLPPAGEEQGWEWQGNAGWFLSKFLCPYDKVGGYFYPFNYGPPSAPQIRGVWRHSDNTDWEQMCTSSPVPTYVYNLHMRVVPGKAGHLFMTAGPGLVEPLMRSDEEGREGTWRPCITDAGQHITTVSDIGFGKAAAGCDYPAIRLWGQVDGVYGYYGSIDNLRSLVFLGDGLGDHLLYPAVIAGKMDADGVFFCGTPGNGVIRTVHQLALR